MRLKCLELALTTSDYEPDVVRIAEKYYDFIEDKATNQ